MKKWIFACILITMFSLCEATSLIYNYKWDADFLKKHEEEGYIGPDLILKNSNGQILISDPAAKRIRLLNNEGRFLKDYVENKRNYWIPLHLITTPSGKILVVTIDKFYFFGPDLTLLKEIDNKFTFQSIAVDNADNLYLYDTTYKKRYSAKVLRIDQIGEVKVLIDYSPQSSNPIYLKFDIETNLILVIKNIGDLEISYYTTNGKLIKKECYQLKVSGKLINSESSKLVFWDKENFVIYITNNKNIKRIDLQKVFSSKNIFLKDILSSANGPLYDMNYLPNEKLLILVSTNNGLTLFEE